MATEKKVTKDPIVSPKGVFKYPKLNTPDFGTTEYPCPEGRFKTKVILSAKQKEELEAKLKPFMDEAIRLGEEAFAKVPPAKKKGKSLTINEVFTPVYEGEVETDEFEIQAKMKASGVNKKTGKSWERTVPIFDSKGKPIKKPPAIWGGTVGKISFTVSPYWIAGSFACGLSLYLEAAFIHELVSGGAGKSADAYGYEADDEDEGGYEYSPEDDAVEDTPSDSAEDESSADEETDF